MFILCGYVCLCVCVPMYGNWRRSEKVLDPLELGSEMIVNHHVSDGNQMWVLWEISQCS